MTNPRLDHFYYFAVFAKKYLDFRKWLHFANFGTEGETIATFRSAFSRSWSRNDHVFCCGGNRFLYLQHLLPQGSLLLRPQDLLPGRWSTATKSSLGSIRWATVLISSHPLMCKTQMWLVNTPSKHKTLTQCWSNSGPPSATLAQHKTSTGSTPRVCWAAGLSVQVDTDPMSVKCWGSVAGAG